MIYVIILIIIIMVLSLLFATIQSKVQAIKKGIGSFIVLFWSNIIIKGY